MLKGVLLLSIATLLLLACAVPVPGMLRKTYKEGDEVQVKTRKLSSIRNLPFDFYSAKFCRPDPIVVSAENLGEYLFGDRIENSPFDINFKREITCKKLATCQADECDPKVICPTLSKSDIEEFIHLIEEDYIAQLIIDNLPVANKQDSARFCGSHPPLTISQDPEDEKYSRPDGYPVGCKSPPNADKVYYINNHLTFVIKYHVKGDETTIVGAEVYPTSIAHTQDSCKAGSQIPRDLPKLKLSLDMKEIPWSYSVRWQESAIRWSSRWDAYISTTDSDEYKIHWFSIVNSLVIVIFLTVMVAMILARVLHKDIAFYNSRTEAEESPQDESGWKLVHGDVFRAPKFPLLLAALAGSGVQVLGVVFATIAFGLVGLLSPANRGSIASIAVLFFILLGFPAGYVAQRLFKTFGGSGFLRTSILTTLLIPGTVATIFIFINFTIWVAAHSSGAVPFLPLFSVIVGWFIISVPLVFIGAYIANKQDPISHPVQVHKIPRQIPTQPLYMRSFFAILIGGILPFGTVFIECYFIMSSLWLHKYYYVFGFLFLVLLILIATCAEITIVMIYFQLCSENYRWWWRSFFTSGSSAFYLFIYSVFYFFSKLHVDSFLMGVVFFGYMSIVTIIMFVFTGAIGFFSTFWFVRRIYGAIKVE